MKKIFLKYKINPEIKEKIEGFGAFLKISSLVILIIASFFVVGWWGILVSILLLNLFFDSD